MNEQINSLEFERLENETHEQTLYNNFMEIMRHEKEAYRYFYFEQPKTKQIFNILDFMSL
jgi:hypothetical protein